MLRLSPPGWNSWRPGQFVMLRPLAWGPELTWGRPFSICACDGQGLSIFYQVVGRGTTRMADLQSGDKVVAWGPLGNGFSPAPGPLLLLAGGVGIAPFVGLGMTHPGPEALHLAFGHRLPLTQYPWDLLPRAMTKESHLDAGPGDLERFVARLEALVRSHASKGAILACGPLPFLRTVQQLALKHGAQAQLSLENRMACGVGACLGCVTETPDQGRVQICTHGPVFPADAVTL